jgi:hypothetical protein
MFPGRITCHRELISPSCLSSVAEDLKEILHRRRSWVGQYFSAYSIRPIIFNAQKRVDGLIECFMVRSGCNVGIHSNSFGFIADDSSGHTIGRPTHSY